jgi:hypothetical protein
MLVSCPRTPADLASLASVDTNCATRKMATETATMEFQSTTAGVDKPTTDLCAPLHMHIINLLSLNPSLQSTSSTTTMPQENVVEKTTAVAPAMPTATKKSAKMRPGVTTTARSIRVTNKIQYLIALFRSLCSQDWCQNNARGTTAEFKVFFDTLPPEDLKVWIAVSIIT